MFFSLRNGDSQISEQIQCDHTGDKLVSKQVFYTCRDVQQQVRSYKITMAHLQEQQFSQKPLGGRT